MPNRERPNVILILADDLGYGDLSCYGSTVNRTPVLDRLAEEGIRFTDFYAPQPLCSPSRAGLMTGCYPRRIGLEKGERLPVLFPGDAIGLSPKEMTLPRLFKNAGYHTELIGKWHLGDQPEFLPGRHGFDHHFGLPYSNDMRLLTEEVLAKEQPTGNALALRKAFPPLPLLQDETIIETEPDQESLTDRYTDEAIAFLDRTAGAPFFLCLSHMYVHLPLYVPEPFRARSRNGDYGAAVEHLDACTGRLLETLDARGLRENTIVFFTSDNGSNGRNGGSNAPLRGVKGSVWEGGMRMPGILRWPTAVAAGQTCQSLTTMMDLLPTLAHLCGGQLGPAPIDGRDISHLWIDPTGPSPHDGLGYYAGGRLAAVRMGLWKLHLDQGKLYRLENDLGETTDCAAEFPEVVTRLSAFAESLRREVGDDATGSTGEAVRPCGRTDHPTALTALPADHALRWAEYD